MKTPLVLFAIVVLAGGGWFLFGDRMKGGKDPHAITENMIARAEKRDIALAVEVAGDVTPAFQIEVKPEVGGKVKALHVEPGDVVKSGDLLAEIDDRDLLTEKASVLTEIEGARLDAEKEQRNFARAKELFLQKLISSEGYENLSSESQIAANNLVKAQRKLDLVEEKIRKAKVTAPIDGTVLTVPVLQGQVVIAAASVNSGTALMTIANLEKLLVETHINQVDVARLELNKIVKLRAESLKDSTMTARISFIAPVATVKANVKGFQVQAVIETADPRLRPGMTVNMNVPIASVDDAVSVPISAVFKGEGNKKIVYVTRGDSTEKREVTVGVTNIDYAEILNGVEEGERILLVEPAKDAKKSS
jgi:RND family efflux transporter MFP subunit